MNRPEVIDPEDRQIVEKLAKLQRMYSQIGGLRTLLPEKLINPTRFALENPDGYDPEKLATYLQDAAQAGSREVERFKKDWHSDDVRELWHAVNAGDVPQGGDAWTLDYDDLLFNNGDKHAISMVVNGFSHDSHPQTDAEIAKIVSDFRLGHPELKVSVLDVEHPLPVDVGLGQLEFRIERDRSASDVTFKVLGKPGTEAFALHDDILETIQKVGGTSNLVALLETTAAYHDIKTRACDKCNKLVNTKLQLPLIRQLKSATSDGKFQFLALHPDCA
ncbi:hypothetical protein LTR41_010713 [Exophiala xenobiotica]|nr:hypothetical protein LTR41_010713 [Exophiala xenobiotica]KAK5420305.1 hypothetical protein LTR06_001777 [Exophiala xenobiotica]